MKFTLIDKHPVTADVVTFVFEPEQPVAPRAGQYFHYVLPHDNTDDRGVERWFTNSSAPFEGHVSISTRIFEQASSFKKALNALEIGATIEADGPEGDFTVDDTSRNYIFVAGGIGITPIRSILAQAQHDGTSPNISLLYGNRSSDIPFKSELDQIASELSDVTIDYLVDPQRIDAQVIKQRADELENPLVYLSGPEPMVKDLATQLETLGLAKESIKLDDFPGYDTI